MVRSLDSWKNMMRRVTSARKKRSSHVKEYRNIPTATNNQPASTTIQQICCIVCNNIRDNSRQNNRRLIHKTPVFIDQSTSYNDLAVPCDIAREKCTWLGDVSLDTYDVGSSESDHDNVTDDDATTNGRARRVREAICDAVAGLFDSSWASTTGGDSSGAAMMGGDLNGDKSGVSTMGGDTTVCLTLLLSYLIFFSIVGLLRGRHRH
jgi:hypothetical protein